MDINELRALKAMQWEKVTLTPSQTQFYTEMYSLAFHNYVILISKDKNNYWFVEILGNKNQNHLRMGS